MIVKDLMKPFLRLECKTTIAKAAELMEKAHTGSALVECNGKPIGVVTERDFLKKVVAAGRNSAIETVDKIMNAPIITIDPDTDIYDASDLMAKKNIRRLAVINEKKEIIGKITTHAISKNVRFIMGKQMVNARTRADEPVF